MQESTSLQSESKVPFASRNEFLSSLAAIREVSDRVAAEVRIFPLLTLILEKSPYIQPLVENLKADGFVATIEKVGYELQRGGNEMLRIQRVSADS